MKVGDWILVSYQKGDDWIEMRHTDLPYEVILQWCRGPGHWHASVSHCPLTTRPHHVVSLDFIGQLHCSHDRPPINDTCEWASGAVEEHVEAV